MLAIILTQLRYDHVLPRLEFYPVSDIKKTDIQYGFNVHLLVDQHKVHGMTITSFLTNFHDIFWL